MENFFFVQCVQFNFDKFVTNFTEKAKAFKRLFCKVMQGN